mgnify:CR=1 FL=1
MEIRPLGTLATLDSAAGNMLDNAQSVYVATTADATLTLKDSASGTVTSSDKDFLNIEMTSMVNEIEQISTNTTYNGSQLLRGDQFTFFADTHLDGLNIKTVSADMAVTSLGVPTGTVNIGGSVAQSDLDTVVNVIDNAILTVNTCLLYTSPSPRDS